MVKTRDDEVQHSIFYPPDFIGGEIVLCLSECESFASILFNHEIFVIMKHYLAPWD